MRAHKLLVAALVTAGGCSLLFDGSDLHGRGGNDDMGVGGDDLAGGVGPDFAGAPPGSDLAHTLTLALTPSTGSPYTVGGAPYALAIGDFDGDGHLDVATADDNDATVTILYGDGKGNLPVKVTVPMAMPPNATAGTVCASYAITTGEFNGAAPLDLAVTCTDQANVNGGMVILGASSRAPTTKAITGLQALTTQVQPQSIAAGDFDHDGKVDIAVGMYTQPGTVQLFKGNGDGTFNGSPSATLATGGSPESVAVGDFNHDGRDDLVVGNDVTTDVTVYLQTSSGALANGVAYPANSHPEGVVAYDVNADKHVDIVTCDPANVGISVLLGSSAGNGTFPTTPPPEYSVDPTPARVAFGDLDADGHADAVTADQGGEAIDILLGNGDGSFKTAVKLVETTPSDVKIGDFNEDGLPDVVVSNNRSTGGVTLLLNTSH